jgi:saccharopine dehydrogenase (NAD+, L-lysine-forming)
MNARIPFGIVGGYGATGREVVYELATGGDRILIGGRNLAKAKAFAAEFDGEVSASQLDVMNAQSLHDFCGQCSIVVNCAGPVLALRDRVAQAAFRRHCNYVDPAGMSFVAERMRDKSKEIADSGLSFVVSAGWMPGITEAVVMHARAQAMQQMDTVESVTLYYGDSGEWSENALLDGAWYIRQLGLRSPDYFHNGERTRASRSAAFSTVDLGSPIGKRRFGLFFTPELNQIGGRLNDCEFLAYSYVSGFRTIFTSILIASLPLLKA